MFVSTCKHDSCVEWIIKLFSFQFCGEGKWKKNSATCAISQIPEKSEQQSNVGQEDIQFCVSVK